MIDRTTIEKIVVDILKEQGFTSRGAKPTLLVICSKEPEAKTLATLQDYWEPIVINPNTDDLPSKVEEAVFLNVDQDLLVKSAIGITDTNMSFTFSELMMKGSRIYFELDTLLDRFINDSNVGTVTSYYREQLKQYYEKVVKYGVSFTKLEEIKPMNSPYHSPAHEDMRRYSEKLLTQSIIESWDNEEIIISNDTIVTPMARDAARERSILIRKQESQGGE
ncbi:hypothetical protein [Guptibacillus algicola]|uniref:hypothetical protein n=1 Tax=Guptibacillus algicola TaxID=225844 RepID=UPI001CD294D1|nr:hypothetical protein [Alkalihalobacillus algicola]MCA0988654.1 hypothetical protein [Alkalihalobacillus algicola]